MDEGLTAHWVNPISQEGQGAHWTLGKLYLSGRVRDEGLTAQSINLISQEG